MVWHIPQVIRIGSRKAGDDGEMDTALIGANCAAVQRE
jgi:hypothetical protein